MSEAQGPSREQLRAHRQVFWDAWQKAEADLPLNALEVRIAYVIGMHPEYHHFFNDMESFLDRDFPADGGINPYLHMSLHLALEEQVVTHQPPDVGRALLWMISERKMDRHDALHILMENLAETMHSAQSRGQEPDAQAYVEKVRRLMQP